MDNPPLPDWSRVRCFLAVAEEGSLSRAARRLGLSQPTLGRQIRALEEDLGAELFTRHARGLSLSATGAALMDPAREMRAAAARLALAAAPGAARLAGTVRITASVAMSFHHLPAMLARIRAAEPEITIDLSPTDSTRNLLFREADIALRMYRPTQPDLIALHLGDLDLGVFAARRYLERAGRPERAEDLLSHDVIGYDAEPLIIEGFRAAGYPVDRDFFALRCDDNSVYWALLCAGCGIGFAQRSAGRAAPGLEELHLGLDLPKLPLWLTTHEAMRRTPRTARIWDLLRDELRAMLAREAG